MGLEMMSEQKGNILSGRKQMSMSVKKTFISISQNHIIPQICLEIPVTEISKVYINLNVI